MPTRISPSKAGLVLAVLFGGWHLIWAMLVAMHWAQPLIDFIFRLHFITPVYVVGAFNLATAALLIAVTALIGLVIGFVFALVWNRLHQTD